MAIVKATYTKNRAIAQASPRYIEHRPGKDRAKITRALFGADGLMRRHQAYRLMDEVPPGSLFYRLVLSPDPQREDTRRDLHLRDITEQTMQPLSQRLKKQIAWIAAEHNDHAPHRHVHIVAIVPRRLRVQDFQALRLTATAAAYSQRRERDLARGVSSARRSRPSKALKTKAWGGKPQPVLLGLPIPTCTCPRCGYGGLLHTASRVHRCNACGFKLHQENALRLNRKEATW